MRLCLLAALASLHILHALHPPPLVRVWDRVFSPEVLQSLVAEGERRAHSFTCVFSRGRAGGAHGRTIIERSLCTLLDEIGDDARFVEYWWRGEWLSMGTHRDVDEALCRTQTRGEAGVQRCPDWGHVLYLDVDDGVHAPTCVWEEDGEVPQDGEDVPGGRAGGAPRSLRSLHVVPARAGRLLRFRGDMLHAVPKPTLEWLPAGFDAATPRAVMDVARRSVVLFNTWGSAPPLIPTVDEPPARRAVAALSALDEPPSCLPRAQWRAAKVKEASHMRSTTLEDRSLTSVAAPMLGDVRRRGCAQPAICAAAPASALLTALTSVCDVHAVALQQPGDASAVVPSPEAGVKVDAAEELAIRLGYAEHLEAEFFGAGDSEWEEDDDDDW